MICFLLLYSVSVVNKLTYALSSKHDIYSGFHIEALANLYYLLHLDMSLNEFFHRGRNCICFISLVR